MILGGFGGAVSFGNMTHGFAGFCEELVLTFRNRPLARLLPFASPAPPAGVDPALQFSDEPENLDPMSNTQMDALIYG
jgi:hypothetical protein